MDISFSISHPQVLRDAAPDAARVQADEEGVASLRSAFLLAHTADGLAAPHTSPAGYIVSGRTSELRIHHHGHIGQPDTGLPTWIPGSSRSPQCPAFLLCHGQLHGSQLTTRLHIHCDLSSSLPPLLPVSAICFILYFAQ